MPKFLISVPHEGKKESCNQVVEVFQSTGSHFLTNADFGCADDVHKAWISLSADSREDAKQIVPPQFRDQAKIIYVKQFVLDKVDSSLKPHHQ